jgi:hypothetical protein
MRRRRKALLQNSWGLCVIAVEDKIPQPQEQRLTYGSQATVDLIRADVSSHRWPQRRRKQAASSARRRKKVAAVAVFTLLTVASLYLSVLWVIAVAGLYFAIASKGWLPMPRGPWSDDAEERGSRAPEPDRSELRRAGPHTTPPRPASSWRRRRRARRGGRACRRARVRS